MIARLSALALLVALNPAAAMAQEADAVDFFAGQGCAIGPSTRDAAMRAGLDQAAIDTLADRAAAHPDTIRTGDWLVLPPDMCRMRIPAVESEIGLADPEVAASLSAVDEFADEGEPGCFLDQDALMERLQAERGWDEERAYTAYIHLTAAALGKGKGTWFSPSNLMTPRNFQFLAGACGTSLPEWAAIRENHAFVVANFDTLVRHSAVGTECVDGAKVDAGPPEAGAVTGTTQNAWSSFEVMFITLGAGWYEGHSLTEKGTPRPPLCHYPAAD